MRLSRTAWLALGIGVFIIAFACLYTVNSAQSREQERLNASLSTAQARLPKLSSERGDLQSQLAQRQEELANAESSLDVAKAKFPPAVESVDYDEILVKIAGDCGLEVSELTASEPKDMKVKVGEETIIYTTTTFEVTVRAAGYRPTTVWAFETYIDGTIANILEFINTVATGKDFTHATIESVSMENLEPPATWNEVTGAKKPSATITLIIYSYKGE